MWIEWLANGKYKYFERYRDPYTEKWRRVSVTLDSGSNRAKKEAQHLLDKKIQNTIQKLTTTDAFFHTIFAEWWTFHQKEIKTSSVRSIEATIQRIAEGIDQYTKIANINVRFIQALLDNAQWTYSQKYRAKTVLNTFFDYAFEQELIDNNPARKAKLPRKRLNTAEIKSIKDKYLEPEEYNALLDELYRKDITRRYALASEFMLLNGCRIGELAALRLNNYHIEDRTLDIHSTFNRYMPEVDEGTKTFASYRTVYLTNREIEILDEIIALNKLSDTTNPKWYKSDRIFVTNTGKPIHSSLLANSLKRANKRLEKPIPKDISPHIFRHTMISLLAENNIPLKTIMDRVGHADSSVTTTIYTHVTKNMKDQSVKILDTIIGKRTK